MLPCYLANALLHPPLCTIFYAFFLSLPSSTDGEWFGQCWALYFLSQFSSLSSASCLVLSCPLFVITFSIDQWYTVSVPYCMQGVTKRCRLSWLTNSALVNEPKWGREGGQGGFAGPQLMSTAVQWYTGAQINFGDLTPSLTYGCMVLFLLLCCIRYSPHCCRSVNISFGSGYHVAIEKIPVLSNRYLKTIKY